MPMFVAGQSSLWQIFLYAYKAKYYTMRGDAPHTIALRFRLNVDDKKYSAPTKSPLSFSERLQLRD